MAKATKNQKSHFVEAHGVKINALTALGMSEQEFVEQSKETFFPKHRPEVQEQRLKELYGAAKGHLETIPDEVKASVKLPEAAPAPAERNVGNYQPEQKEEAPKGKK